MTDPFDAVLAMLRARFGADAATEELAAFLAAEGFDRRQIGEIVRRFRAESSDDAGARAGAGAAAGAPLRAAFPPVRVPGPHERGRFTPDAWALVLRLAASGLLSLPDLERVIDRALEHGEGRVDVPALRAVLDAVGLGDAADSDTTTIH